MPKKSKEISTEREEELWNMWTMEIEDAIAEAIERSYEALQEDPDEDLLLKYSAIYMFISRFQYVFHQKLKGIKPGEEDGDDSDE
jgi:hypothetical protein